MIDWELVQGPICLSAKVSWDRLKLPATLHRKDNGWNLKESEKEITMTITTYFFSLIVWEGRMLKNDV